MKKRLMGILVFMLLLTACSPSVGLLAPPLPTPPRPASAGEPNTLRYLASQRGFLIGAAVDADALQSDPAYADTLAREYNVVVPENVMKFSNIHPSPDIYDFSAADALVDFAQANGMLVRGHTLVWYAEDPDWVNSGNFTKDQLEQILHDHIATVVGRYKGRVFAWDVVNEAIDDNGQLRDSVWLRGIGPEYIDLAFQWAHEADPNALLFYNDYNGEGLGGKSDAIYNLVKGLHERGAPIGGVGLQMHVTLKNHPSMDDLRANIQRLARLGLVVHITEMDVRLQQPADDQALNAQAQIYKDVVQTCLAEERACQALLTWGFTDKYSWIPNFYGGFGGALPFDQSLDPKAAYNAIKAVLSGN